MILNHLCRLNFSDIIDLPSSISVCFLWFVFVVWFYCMLPSGLLNKQKIKVKYRTSINTSHIYWVVSFLDLYFFLLHRTLHCITLWNVNKAKMLLLPFLYAVITLILNVTWRTGNLSINHVFMNDFLTSFLTISNADVLWCLKFSYGIIV